MSARGSRKRLPFEVARRLERVDDRFGPELGRRQVDADAVALAAREAVDGPIVQMRTPFRSRTSLVASSRSMKYSTALALVNTIQSKRRRLVAGAAERVGILRRRDPDRRRRDRFGAALLEHLDELARLLARAGDDDPPAEERPLVEPAQVLAQPGDRADHEQRRARRRGRAKRCRRACPGWSPATAACRRR